VLAEGKFWQAGEAAEAKGSGVFFHVGDGDSHSRREAVSADMEKDSRPLRSRFSPAYWRSVAAIGMQTAEALHYAHAHHTLHRDVKPANLLLDSQGVVWVTDFGLAKAVDQDNPSQTAGLAGTLRYMAPEQFSGRVDARSDVYSLGLTLYELVTLQPAFVDISRSKLIRKITQGQPVRPRQVNPAIPRDLETIILKAIAHEPAHRYKSAADLAGDLQRFLDDRPITARRVSAIERLWRWSRRNRAVAALTTSTFVLLVLFAVVATTGYVSTTRERQRAEATSVLALEALDNIFQQFAPERTATASGALIVGDTGEEITVPAQPALSKEAAALLEHMLAFYDRLAEQGGDDARLRRKVAEANRRVGDIRQRLGDYEESKAAYLRAIERYTQLSEASEDDAELGTETARIHNELGNLHVAMNQYQEAQSSYSSALATLQGAAPELSGSPQQHYELARTYYSLGKRPFGQLGPFPLAPFGRRFPKFGSPSRGFAMTGSPWPPRGPGMVETSQGSSLPSGFRGRPKRGAEPPPGPPPDGPGPPKGEAGAPSQPTNSPSGPSRSRRAFPFGTPEDLEKFRQREKEREENLQKAIDLLERLVAEHPAAPDYRHLLARCYREVGPKWPVPGSKPTSDGVDKAAEILQKLVEEHPDVPDYRYDLSLTCAWLSTWPSSSERSNSNAEQRMRQMLEKAVTISDELVAEHPNIPDYAVFHVRIRMRLADALWESDPSRAEASLRKALDLQTTLARRFPQKSFYKLGLGYIQESLAIFLRDRDELPEARALTDDCIVSLKASLDQDPKLWHARGMLAQNYWNLADVLARLDDEQAAAESAQQAQELQAAPPKPPAGPPGR
jgi:serine/threonine protein kinase